MYTVFRCQTKLTNIITKPIRAQNIKLKTKTFKRSNCDCESPMNSLQHADTHTYTHPQHT